ncbi:MAG: carboxymuconolactone decarboxylase family protein [Solirubrobacteraceae bacterium]
MTDAREGSPGTPPDDSLARVPLVAPGGGGDPIVADVFARFATEGRSPISLYRALANAPALVRAYSGLAVALRHEASTPRTLRELAILRTAQLTGSRYEWCHHLPMARAAGVGERQIDGLDEWHASGDAFDERERAVLRCADELHQASLSDAAFAELQRHFNAAEITELLLVVSFYQAVARLIAGFGLQVEHEYELEPDG